MTDSTRRSRGTGLRAPAAERNKDAILEVLQRVLPERGLVLEIASGTGQHVLHFAHALPRLDWQPSDPDPEMRASIAAHIDCASIGNVRSSLALDVLAEPWPLASADAVLCINMIHIAPWAATTALLQGAARLLDPDALLILYGPFSREGRHTAPSNAAFDQSLRARDPGWGVRDLEVVTGLASEAGFSRDEVVSMPANNLSVIFRRRS